ncbi:MAG: hypothetical protein ACJ76X_19055 [Solirubrobacteraceae bacterium]
MAGADAVVDVSNAPVWERRPVDEELYQLLLDDHFAGEVLVVQGDGAHSCRARPGSAHWTRATGSLTVNAG